MANGTSVEIIFGDIMYLEAHRIKNKYNTNQQVDHFFHYEHQNNVCKMPTDDVASYGLAILKKQLIIIPPGGNEILSFIDIVCSNSISTKQIRSSFIECINRSKIITPNINKYTDLKWNLECTDIEIEPATTVAPRVPCHVAGGNEYVWFMIAVKQGFWFVEGARLLNKLLDHIDNGNL